MPISSMLKTVFNIFVETKIWKYYKINLTDVKLLNGSVQKEKKQKTW